MFGDPCHANDNPMMAYPTSPWTEAFQAAPRHHADAHDGVSSPSCFDNDDLRPTHDALSDIYNRGY